MTKLDRRRFLAAAVALGASAGWSRARAAPSKLSYTERRDLYPEGVASGDPDEHSVMLWTRRPGDNPGAAGLVTSIPLTAEVAEDEAFHRVVAAVPARALADSDWTCRAMVGGLKPGREYWYRFIDADGQGSRIGRTLTAPAHDDRRPARFAFVSCQNMNVGSGNAYRRMIHEDKLAKREDQLGFVLHLGDFIYELVWYPPDRPQGYYDRRLRDVVRYPTGEKISDFHVPADLTDYRAVYRGYLKDPDLMDARARWPFVTMWDNHEFSWLGWQSLQVFNGKTIPAQTRKVAANQAWFEYQPARVTKPSGPSLDRFDPPAVKNVAITAFDEHGLGQEPNNLTAIGSLTGYRALTWGPHIELIITDQHSYRSEDPFGRAEGKTLGEDAFYDLFPQELAEAIDAGRDYNGGHPPDTLKFGGEIPNYRKTEAPQTILGAEQKRWFLERLRTSRATWKIWGNTEGSLESRVDAHNLPAGLTPPWPGAGYAHSSPGGDYGSAFTERAEIYDLIAREKITGFATVAGDRHSFWAGYSAKALPPAKFEPVGVSFITGSISAPGLVEAQEHKFPKDHPLKPLYAADRPGEAKPVPTVNMLWRHGVKSCLEYAKSGDLAKARALSNPDLAPHLEFLDMGGHGYAVVEAAADAMAVEFVCIPRPLERSETDDGGPLRYRVTHRAKLWKPGEAPKLTRTVNEGDPGLSI